jgi:predicted AAA+ superfamily ATPase
MERTNYIPRIFENYAFDENLTGRHMVFMAGARQVGKTMLAKHWLKKKVMPALLI